MEVPLEDMAADYEALTQFLYIAPVGLVQTAIDGEIAMINPISAQLLMPLSRDGDLTNLFVALENVAPDLAHLTRSFERPHGLICDAVRIQVRAGEGRERDPQVLSLSLLKLDATRLMGVLNDVTAQVRRERLLRQNEAWLNAILTGITDYALVSLDADGCIDEWNASIGRVTGFSREAALGRPYSIFYPNGATTPDRVRDRLREAAADGWSLDDGWRLRADGSRFWGSAMIAPLQIREDPDDADRRGSGGHSRNVIGRSTSGGDGTTDKPGYCLVIRDITDKREATETQRQAVSCDHLTGIANRRTFFEAAELEIERWKRSPRDMSLVIFDADHFKEVNDRYGHPAGDAVLRHFATLLTDVFRAVDVVARIGGEEFAVLLPSTNLQGAMTVANRLRQVVASQVVEFDGASIAYTVSGGVATMSQTLVGLDALLKRADEALYAAKATGRNRIESLAAAAEPILC